jgi:hypothetical protein
MSYSPLAGCLVACLLTLAPAVTTRAEDGGVSARRKAEIDALIVRRHAEKAKRNHVAAIRNAELARQLAQAQAYELGVAQAVAAYQTTLARQSMMQMYRYSGASGSTSPQTYYPGSASPAGWYVPAYASGPVFVNFNAPSQATSAPQGSPVHSGAAVGEGHPAHAFHHGHTH